MMINNRRYRFLAVNQSTSLLFRQLVEALCATYGKGAVKLLSGYLEGASGANTPFIYLKGRPLKKTPAVRRIITWGFFTLQSVHAMLRYHDHLFLLTTNPPLVPWVAPILKRFLNIRYIALIYDVYPDVMERMGMVSAKGAAAKVMRKMSAQSHRNAECVITLSDGMRRTVLSHLRVGEAVDIHVIPNWADVRFIQPIERDHNPFIQQHGLSNKFIIMYSGAFGATHDIESILDAAQSLQDLENLQFVLIGKGTRESELKRMLIRRELRNLKLIPFQPLAALPYSLASADCHIVSLDEGFEGVSMPSKAYTSLAVGAAILAIGAEDSDLAHLVEEHDCGLCIRPRSAISLANGIRRLYDDRLLLDRMKANSREAAEKYYSLELCTSAYTELLRRHAFPVSQDHDQIPSPQAHF